MFEFNDKIVTVPQWIIEKNLTPDERYAWSVGDGEVLERETEKAVRVSQMTDFGKVSLWCPKSVLVSEEQVEAENRRIDEAIERGKAYNEYLKSVARHSGIKLGNAKRTATIIEKLEAAGIEYIAKVDFVA